MKKLITILIFVFCIGHTKDDTNKTQNQYLNYTNKIINYYFKLDLDNIKSPFYSPKPKTIIFNMKNIENKEIIKINLISILNNQAYIKVEKYLGDKLISTNKKWLKINEKNYNCKLIKLTDIEATFKCGNKILIKSINKKFLFKKENK